MPKGINGYFDLFRLLLKNKTKPILSLFPRTSALLSSDEASNSPNSVAPLLVTLS